MAATTADVAEDAGYYAQALVDLGQSAKNLDQVHTNMENFSAMISDPTFGSFFANPINHPQGLQDDGHSDPCWGRRRPLNWWAPFFLVGAMHHTLNAGLARPLVSGPWSPCNIGYLLWCARRPVGGFPGASWLASRPRRMPSGCAPCALKCCPPTVMCFLMSDPLLLWPCPLCDVLPLGCPSPTGDSSLLPYPARDVDPVTTDVSVPGPVGGASALAPGAGTPVEQVMYILVTTPLCSGPDLSRPRPDAQLSDR